MPRPYSTGGTESARRKRGKQPLGVIYFIQEAADPGAPVKIGYCAGALVGRTRVRFVAGEE